MMDCRSGLVTIPVLMDTEALGKLLIQELWISILWIILLALKAVVTTNNYTHSSCFLLTTLAGSNPTVCPVSLQFMPPFLCLFAEMSGMCMTDVIQLSHQ